MKEAIDVGFRIKAISDLLEQQANQWLKDYDLTLAQMKVLHYLRRQDGYTAKLKEIEKFFRVSQPTMAGIAIRLEEKGFVVSGSAADDKRIKILTLSDKGVQVCNETYARQCRWKKIISDKLGKENIEELCRLLDQLYEAMTEHGKEGEQP